ncbi:MAG: MFS transporter [Halocynthiibacter sp.]
MAEISLKKKVWGWFFYDWASQPYHTLLVTFIFGPYFAAVLASHLMGTGLSEGVANAQAQSTWAWGQMIAGLIIGFSAPILGAIADNTRGKMPWVVFFSLLTVLGSAMLWNTLPDGSNAVSMLVFFCLGFVGVELSLIFINAFLPGLGDEKEIGRISGSGYAFGYAGGVLSLILMLLLFQETESGKTLIGIDPLFGFDASLREGTRFVGPFAAIWYIVFMIPFFLWVREDPKYVKRGGSVTAALMNLWATIKSLPKRKSLGTYLLSSMIYRDALNGLYSFGGVYAKLVLGWPLIYIGIFGIVGAISAAVFAWVGGRADHRFGPKPVIKLSIFVLLLVTLTIVFMTRDSFFGIALPEGSAIPDITFFICGALIGAAGGTLQAASRSMMVRHIESDNPTEAFGLYALSGRATAFLAPALIGVFTIMLQSARLGVTPLIGLFLIGLFLLRWVHPDGSRASK